MTINFNCTIDMTTEDIKAVADVERQQNDRCIIDNKFDEIGQNIRRRFDAEINRMMRDYERASEEMNNEYKKDVAQMNADCERELADIHKRLDAWAREHGIK